MHNPANHKPNIAPPSKSRDLFYKGFRFDPPETFTLTDSATYVQLRLAGEFGKSGTRTLDIIDVDDLRIESQLSPHHDP